jgi:hypothetical protein
MTRVDLVSHTQELLNNRSRKITYEVIIDGCQPVEITYTFLTRLAAGKLTHPSVTKIQAVYEFLTGKSLINS